MSVKHLFKCVFGVALLAGLFAMADLAALWNMVQTMHMGFALLGLLCFVLTSGLDMWRLWLASPAAQQICWLAFIRMHFESYIMAQLLPGHMGVDAYRVAVIGKSQSNYMEPAVILFGLRLLSMAVMLGITVVLILALPQWQGVYMPYFSVLTQKPLWPLLLVAMVGCALCLAGYKIAAMVWRRLHPRLHRLSEAYAALTFGRAMALVGICLGMIALRIATFIFTLYAFGINMPLMLASSVALCATLSWLLPLSPAGIGVREGVITGLLVWLGIPYSPALAVALLNRLYFLGFALLGGVSFLFPAISDKKKPKVVI